LIQGIVIDVIKNEPTEKEVSPNNWPKSERKKPKGGCELVYPGKVNEDFILKKR